MIWIQMANLAAETTNPVVLLLGFMAIAGVGLYAAVNSKGFSRHFLSKDQRDRMTPEGEKFIPLVGWLLFAFGALATIAIAFNRY